jgi:hypothetical protein
LIRLKILKQEAAVRQYHYQKMAYFLGTRIVDESNLDMVSEMYCERFIRGMITIDDFEQAIQIKGLFKA